MTMLTAVSAMTASDRSARRAAAGDRRPASRVWPLDGAGVAGASSHIPERDEQQTEHEQAGDDDEDDQARVRVLEQAQRRRQ